MKKSPFIILILSFSSFIAISYLFIAINRSPLKPHTEQWNFASNGSTEKNPVIIGRPLYGQIPGPCCSGRYTGELEITKNQTNQAVYFPAIGGLISIEIEGNKSFYTGDFSSIGPIVSLNGNTSNPLQVEIEIQSKRNALAGIWKAKPIVDDISVLTKIRNRDFVNQIVLPSAWSIFFFCGAMFFLWIYYRLDKEIRYYLYFATSLLSWSFFYLFLSGFPRELSYNLGIDLHLVSRVVGAMGVYFLLESFNLFIHPQRSVFIFSRINVMFRVFCIFILTQAILGISGHYDLQSIVYSAASIVSFVPALDFLRSPLKQTGIYYLTQYLTFLTFFGQFSDAIKILGSAFDFKYMMPYFNRYTFPLILTLSLFYYLSHFIKFFQTIKITNRKLKDLSDLAVNVVMQSNVHFDISLLPKIASESFMLQKCSLYSFDGNHWKVISSFGHIDEIKGEILDLSGNPEIIDALSNKKVVINTAYFPLSPQRYRTGARVVVPIPTGETPSFLLLGADPKNRSRFYHEDELIFSKFSSLIWAQYKRVESENSFRSLVSQLDPSLYSYVTKAANNGGGLNIKATRALGYMDQVGFSSMLSKITPSLAVEVASKINKFLAPIAMRYGARFKSFGGDAFLIECYHFKNESDSDVAIRLVDMLWEFSESVIELNQILLKSGVGPISYRFGAHFGEVADLEIGFIHQGAVTIFGDAVNRTHRLQELARPGSIVVSEEMGLLIEKSFLTRPLHTESLRGVGKSKANLIVAKITDSTSNSIAMI